MLLCNDVTLDCFERGPEELLHLIKIMYVVLQIGDIKGIVHPEINILKSFT